RMIRSILMPAARSSRSSAGPRPGAPASIRVGTLPMIRWGAAKPPPSRRNNSGPILSIVGRSRLGRADDLIAWGPLRGLVLQSCVLDRLATLLSPPDRHIPAGLIWIAR